MAKPKVYYRAEFTTRQGREVYHIDSQQLHLLGTMCQLALDGNVTVSRYEVTREVFFEKMNEHNKQWGK